MILTTISLMMILNPQPTTVKASVVSASMFKNGYAVVLREFAVPSAGDYELASLPPSSVGTLWFTAMGGVKLTSVKTVTHEQSSVTEWGSIDAILQNNIWRKAEARLHLQAVRAYRQSIVFSVA